MKKTAMMLVMLMCALFWMLASDAEEMGWFLEETVLTPPEGISLFSLAVDQNGRMYSLAVDEQGCKLVRFSQDQEKFEQIPLDIMYQSNVAIAISPDDGIVVSAYDDETGSTVFFGVDDKGNILYHFSVEGMINCYAALPDRRVALLNYGGSVLMYDEEGTLKHEIAKQDVWSIQADEQYLYVCGGWEITTFSLDTYESAASVATDRYMSNTLAIGGGKVYAPDADAIYGIDRQSGLCSERISTLGTSLGNPYNEIDKIFWLEEDAFVAMVTVREDNLAYRQQVCLLTKKPIDTEQTQLTITMLRDNPLVTQAASAYQREHPEIHVALQKRFDPWTADQVSVDDHIRALNTEIVAGNAGDVIVLDGLPYAGMMRRGTLVDLSGIAQSLDFMPGIADAMLQAETKTYMIPTQFTTLLLWGKEAAIGKVERFADLLTVPIKPGQALMSARSPEDLLRLFFPVCSVDFYDEAGKMDVSGEAFRSFLQTIYSLHEAQAEAVYINPMDAYAEDFTAIYLDEIAMFPSATQNFYALSRNYSAVGAEEAFVTVVPSVEGQYAFYPQTMLGILESSGQKDLAEDFVLHMCKKETLMLDDRAGFPILADAMAQTFAETKGRFESRHQAPGIFRIPGDANIVLEVYEPDEVFYERLSESFDRISAPILMDDVLLDIIVGETKAYFNGSMTLDDAIEAIANRTFIYLHE